MKVKKAEFLKILKKLVGYPSITGKDEFNPNDDIREYICEYFKKYNINCDKKRRNGLIFEIPGRKNNKKTKNETIFSAHYDVIGAMVSRIEKNGKVRITKLGGFSYLALLNNKCTIFCRNGKKYSGRILAEKWTPHIFNNSEIENQNFIEDNIYIRVDEQIYSDKDNEKLGIEVGNFVFISPEFYTTKSGYISSRYLDDKASVSILMYLVSILHKDNFANNVPFSLYLSANEETGLGTSFKFDKKYSEFIAVDMGVIGPGQESSEDKVTICVKDSSFAYDESITNKMVSICKKNKIKYCLDVFRSYGSDAGALLRTGQDMKVGLIGPGIHSSHSYERTNLNAINETLKLIYKYIS